MPGPDQFSNYFLGGLLGLVGLLVVLYLGRAAIATGNAGKVWTFIKVGLVVAGIALAAQWLNLI